MISDKGELHRYIQYRLLSQNQIREEKKLKEGKVSGSSLNKLSLIDFI